jgi:NAD(P)-dependent dehydrogenase (short-subunit alcohol dehydrogenase family)
MQNFQGKLAVITGAGDGMGRALAEQLTAAGCHVALCDISEESLAESRARCLAGAPNGVVVTTHLCDVGVEEQIVRFRDEVLADHMTDHVNLLFNNAGVGGGASMITSPRETWDRTFDICWGGVYWGVRAFMDALVASDEAVIVNTSSVNGFWASLGPGLAHTSYSAAKFAVKGFTEALITDLRLHAPHVRAAVVMPGHIGTGIAGNTVFAHGGEQSTAAAERAARFRNTAPMTAAEAATVILDGVRAERWRILIGDDAHVLDLAVRQAPEEAYDVDFPDRLGEHLQGLPRD